MGPALFGLLGAAGVVLLTDDDKPAPKPAGAVSRTAATAVKPLAPQSTSKTGVAYIRPPYAVNASGMTGEAELAIRKKLEAEYNSLSGAAKKAACERLKKQFPADSNVQSLNCADATFQKIVTVVGAAVGTALCGPTCGALGVIAAQYFGEDINKLWSDFQSKIGGDGDPCTNNPFFKSEAECRATLGRY